MKRLLPSLIALLLGSAIAYAQFQTTGTGGIGAPGGISQNVQYNTNGIFGGIANGVPNQCLTWATPPVWGSCAAGSQTSIAQGANITTTGTASNVTVSVSPSGSTGQLQYNATSALGAVTGASSNGTNVAFTTGNLALQGKTLFLSGNTGTIATVTNTLASGNCIQADANGNLKDSGSTACGGTIGAVTSVNNNDGSLVVNPTAGAVSITLATPVTLSRGGTSAALIPFNGGLVTFTSTSMAITTMATALVIDGPTGAAAYTGTTCNSVIVQLGGAGLASCGNYTAHSLLVGEGTNNFNLITGASASLLLGQGAATDPSFNAMSQDCTISSTGVITCTKTNNVSFSALATASTPLTMSLGGSSASLVPALGGVVNTTSTSMAVTTLTAGLLAVSPTATIASVALPLTMAEGGTSAGLVPAAGGIITSTSTAMAVTTLTTGVLIASSTTTLATNNSLVFSTAIDSFTLPVTISGNLTATIGAFTAQTTSPGASHQTATIAGNLTGSTAAFSSLVTASIYTGTPAGAGMMSFVSPSISQFQLAGTTNAPTPATGWLNWGGESRLTAVKSLFNSSGLTPTTLSVNLQAGRSYSVDADLYINAPAAGATSGGIQVALTGTYGSSATNYFGYVVDGGSNTGANGTFNSTRGAALSAAKNTSVGSTLLSGTTAYLKITGTITASSSGTLVVAAAQNSATTAATTLAIGSRLLVHDMP